ncbi:inhibitor of apoptosis-promoting Bax1-domain-containing protein [Leucosporidium creatinivorum]|uniref:Inhibitor of apoptosis-promoting Bax1-domain-containing protein n=1 Tax=Leucosporidium creatinivorum TaxID=106004 RepID=A0A1Y2DF05_9BASI|nr:inhibitor of apoptosis-promoting Bax1-domain-containing protein [Leucosporidium creatinivorum]
MASLRTALPRLLQHAPIAPALRATKQPIASTSRLFSTSRPAESPFNSLLRRFPRAERAHGKGPQQGRSYQSAAPVTRQADQVDWTAVATRVGLAGVAAVGINYALNRETRDALSAYESSFLNDTFKWSAAGLAITAAVAKGLHSSGFAVRLMSANPWLVMGVGLAASIGSMAGVYYTAPDSAAHYASWAVFSAVQGATLSPMFFIAPAILSRAGLYTVGAMSGLCYVGATAKSEQFMNMGGVLMCGLGVLVAASLAPMVLPRMMTVQRLSVLEHVTAYGGVGLFSMFILYDTQKILRHAQLAKRGVMPRDPFASRYRLSSTPSTSSFGLFK